MDSDEQLAQQRLGEVINGRWKLERLLGVGGMAAVYAASDDSGNHMALKVLHPEMSRRPDIKERFLREGEAANTVAHPGVVTTHPAAGGDGDTAVLVMELLEGESLTAAIDRSDGHLPIDTLLDVLDQVLDVLAAAHAKGIIHRDLKPDNLFLTTSGRVKVLDFGIARMNEGTPARHKTKTGIALGTVPYMAPEQALAKHNQIDARTDLYALGAMAFRVLSGRTIHVTETEPEMLIAMASKPAPALRSIAPQISADVASIIDVALAFSKDARYPDARTMQDDVRAVQKGSSPPFATHQLASRETATRTDLVAPVIPDAIPEPPPSAYATTEVDKRSPDRAATTLVDKDKHEAPTVQMSSVPTLAVAAHQAGDSKGSSGKRVGLWIALAGVLVAGGAAAVVGFGSATEEPPSAGRRSATASKEPTAPTQANAPAAVLTGVPAAPTSEQQGAAAVPPTPAGTPGSTDTQTPPGVPSPGEAEKGAAPPSEALPITPPSPVAGEPPPAAATPPAPPPAAPEPAPKATTTTAPEEKADPPATAPPAPAPAPPPTDTSRTRLTDPLKWLKERKGHGKGKNDD